MKKLTYLILLVLPYFYIFADEVPTITITGNGIANFSSSTPNAFNTGATAGFGLSCRFKNQREFGIIGTVTETRDTINSQDKSAFAASILVPGIRKFSVMVNFRDLKAFNENWGWGVFVNATPMHWQTFTVKSVNSVENDSLPLMVTILPITFEFYGTFTLYNSEYIEEPKPMNTTRINFDMGITFKTYGTQLTDNERDLFLGSHQDFFAGIFGGVDLHFSGAKAYFYATYIPAIGNNSSNINGLTGLQIVGGIALKANVAKLTE